MSHVQRETNTWPRNTGDNAPVAKPQQQQQQQQHCSFRNCDTVYRVWRQLKNASSCCIDTLMTIQWKVNVRRTRDT